MNERFLHYKRPVNVTTQTNGLTILSVEVPSETVLVQCVVAAGAMHDEANPGVVHFLEHMLFEGPDRGEYHPALSPLVALGISANAETSRTFTSFSIHGFAQHYSAIAKALGQIVSTLDINHSSLKLERKVILRELDEAENHSIDAEGTFVYPCFPEAYRPICGTKTSVQEISWEHLERFHTMYYTPSRTLIIVIGNVRHSRVVEEFSRLFSERSNIVRTKYPVIQPRLDRFTIHEGIEIPDVKLYFMGPETAEDYLRLHILQRMCMYETSGIITRSMREFSGMSYGSAWHIEMGTFPCIDVLLGCGETDFNRGVDLFFSAIDDLIERQFDDRLFHLVMANLRLEYGLSADQFTFESFAFMLARRWEQNRLRENSKRILYDTSPLHISRVAERYLTRDKSGEVRYLPPK